MNNDKKQPSKNSSAREQLAAKIYADLIVGNQSSQYTAEKFAKQAREAAEVFYPDELPSPSVPMTKAV